MQATKTVKQTKWQKLWRRANRRTPFWKQRLDERTEGELEPASPVEHLSRWFGDIVDTIFALVTGAVAVSALAIIVIGPLFLSPDFMKVGLADPIGRGLAAVCLSTGQCDPAYLLAGTAVAVPVLLLLVYVALYAVLHEDHDEEFVSDAELRSGLGAIDERLVHLRADLVLAGVLPLSDEEKVEATEDEEAAKEESAKAELG